MGKYDDDEGGYFCELLKEGLTERDMSGLERGRSEERRVGKECRL